MPLPCSRQVIYDCFRLLSPLHSLGASGTRDVDGDASLSGSGHSEGPTYSSPTLSLMPLILTQLISMGRIGHIAQEDDCINVRAVENSLGGRPLGTSPGLRNPRQETLVISRLQLLLRFWTLTRLFSSPSGDSRG